MECAIVYHWTKPVPGRELAALDLKRETDERMQEYQREGRITNYAWFLSTTGDLNYLVVNGEMDTLNALVSEPDLMLRHMRAGMINEGFTWSFCATGESAELSASMFAEAAASVPMVTSRT